MPVFSVKIVNEGFPEEVRLANQRLSPLPPLPVPQKKTGKLIVQIARTNCAGAIWRLHEVINLYTEHTCRTITTTDITNDRRFPHDIFMRQHNEVRKLIKDADVVHFQNWIDYESPEMRPFRTILVRKMKVLQYHSEPRCLCKCFRRDVVNRDDIRTLIIAQKHVRFYPKSIVVPNLVNIWNPMLMPELLAGQRRLKVIYTPSDLRTYPNPSDTCSGKGYEQTLPILKKLEAEGIIEFAVITNKSWEELMPIKKQYDVCIDECVTGGYHLCSLEALSQGLVAIAWIDDQTKEAIKKIVGHDTDLPWVNTTIAQLETTLRRLVAMPLNELQAVKDRGRKWMETNWDPINLVKIFFDAYGFNQQKPQTSQPTPTSFQLIEHQWERKPGLLPVYNVPGNLLPEALALKNAWKDKQVIIWGNGPTIDEALKNQGEDWFKEAMNIGTNAAALIKDICFDAYCIGDLRFLKTPEKLEIAMTAPGVRIYQSPLRSLLKSDRISYVRTIGREGFCSDLIRGVYHGYAVTWLALQVALWTGTKDILLAGCGHDYSGSQPRFYPEKVPSDVDNTFPWIIHNYRNLMPILNNLGIRVRTIGKSRLSEAGVPQLRS